VVQLVVPHWPEPVAFFYELLVNQSTVTTIDSSLQGLAGAGWSDALFQGTNTVQAGRVSSGNTAAQNWPAQAVESYTVVGWSSAEGSDWATVSARLAGASFSGGKWSGPLLVAGGWLGVATVQQAKSGGGSPALASWGLFGAGSSAQGSPIVTPTDMFVVGTIPEPSTFALVGLGSAAMMIFRRRK